VADDARHLHLADAEHLADLALGHVQLEVHAQHAPVAFGDHPHQALEHDALLGDLERVVVDAEAVLESSAVVVVAAELRLHRDAVARVVGVERLEDELLGLVELVRDLRDGRRTLVLGERGDGAVHAQRQLLQRARRAHRPGAVAEVALDLTGDRRHGVGGERHAACRIEAIDGVDEADGGNLQQVLERVASRREAQRDAARERQEALDELLPGDRVARAVVALEERAFVRQACG
jgi:hypothetical protein